jgi:hypothetical protein
MWPSVLGSCGGDSVVDEGLLLFSLGLTASAADEAYDEADNKGADTRTSSNSGFCSGA